MKVVRYLNGRKVQEVTKPEASKPAAQPAVNPPIPKRIIKKVTTVSPAPQANPSQGCGCGK
jgi:hypothetical protein